jgi:hypothetical protein
MNPGSRSEYPTEAHDGLRRAAFDLRAKATAVPCYRFFSWIRMIPSDSAVNEVTINLTGLSNNLDAPEGLLDEWRAFNEKRRQKIMTALGLSDLLWDYLSKGGTTEKY